MTAARGASVGRIDHRARSWAAPPPYPGPDGDDQPRWGDRHQPVPLQRHSARLRRPGRAGQLRHCRLHRRGDGVQPLGDGGGPPHRWLVRDLRRALPQPLGRVRDPLHLLVRPGDRDRVRGGRGGHLHDLLVTAGAGLALVARVRGGGGRRQRPGGEPLRPRRVLAGGDQGERHRALRGPRPVPHLWTRIDADRPRQPLPAARRLRPAWAARDLDGRDPWPAVVRRRRGGGGHQRRVRPIR